MTPPNADQGDTSAASPASSTTTGAAPAAPQERLVVTDHKLKLGRRTLKYSATCGTLVLRDFDPAYGSKDAAKDGTKDSAPKADKPRAAFFFTAYTLKPASADGAAADPQPLVRSLNRCQRNES